MSLISVKLKTHSRTELTGEFLDKLNNCIVHKQIPIILDVVAGRNKEHHYLAGCCSDDCGKISMTSADDVVEIWNKWNPRPTA